ncbi:MAG: hypothetical protein EHM57_06170 [Actinobacteria bacterium]|nr:MAG: hypothetical protein EHM57_06170 [Actinomycetota bacterium]
MSKQDAPAIPDGPQAPSAPGGGKQLPQEKAKTTEAGDTGPGKEATPPTTGPAGGEGADDSVFKMASLTGMLKGLPGYGTITGFMDKAASVWEKIKGFFGRVAKAFKSFFESLGDAIDEVLDGFAAEGLGYLPKLIKKVVGPTVWEIIEPIVEAVAGTADEILELFETDPPKSVDEFFIWGIKLMKKAFGVAFDSIESLVSAINTMSSRLAGTATKMVTQMVTEGMIGVWRHAYYVWMPWPADDYHFLAATEYKIRILDTNISFKEKGMLTSPESAVGIALFEVLESLGVPPTHDGYHEASGQSYRHRWV